VVFPFVNLTRANLRLAELGFFGFITPTAMHTPFRCGQVLSAGDFVRGFVDFRAPRITWFRVASVGEVVCNCLGYSRSLDANNERHDLVKEGWAPCRIAREGTERSESEPSRATRDAAIVDQETSKRRHSIWYSS
jgi:hypothetical protein